MLVLENRCEELQKLLDDARIMLDKQQQAQRRRRERRKSSQSRIESGSGSGSGAGSPDEDREEDVVEEVDNITKDLQSNNLPHSDTESDCPRTGSGSGCGIQESGYR